jgi:hypothetical protein
MKIQKSAWQHKGEWFILPCPKLMLEKTKDDYHLIFEISFLKYTAYFSLVFKRKTFKYIKITV